jgi:hypothetical protein
MFRTIQGKGSCFYFTTPYKEIKRLEEEPEQNIFNTQENWDDKTILIVEDNKQFFILKCISYSYQSKNYSCKIW